MDILFTFLLIFIGGIISALISAVFIVEYTATTTDKGKWVPIPLALFFKCILWPFVLLIHFTKAVVFYIIKHVKNIISQVEADIVKTEASIKNEVGKLVTIIKNDEKQVSDSLSNSKDVKVDTSATNTQTATTIKDTVATSISAAGVKIPVVTPTPDPITTPVIPPKSTN